MKNEFILLGILFLFMLPVIIGMIRSKFNTNSFYGDEMNKKKNKRTLRDESYEKTSNVQNNDSYHNPS